MPDRVIRDELLQSVRWLDLPTDTHRLVYENLILIADDYGNVEGGPRRLFRWMHGFTQVKTEADSIKLMSDLQDSDMVRRYEVNGREYWHLPRFKNSRWYWKRSYPQSPFEDDVTNQEKERPSAKRNTHVDDTSTTRREGVGVGVNLPTTHSKTSNRTTSESWQSTEAGIAAMGAKMNIPARPGESYAAWKDRLLAAMRNKV